MTSLAFVWGFDIPTLQWNEQMWYNYISKVTLFFAFSDVGTYAGLYVVIH